MASMLAVILLVAPRVAASGRACIGTAAAASATAAAGEAKESCEVRRDWRHSGGISVADLEETTQRHPFSELSLL